MKADRLTDEQLREWRDNWVRANWGHPIAVEIIDDLIGLRARKTPATTQLVNLSKSLLDDANAECAELRARVTQLEAALRQTKVTAEVLGYTALTAQIDAALARPAESGAKRA